LTNTPILAYPRNEDSFILDTDASNTCMGAVLSQIQDGKEKVIAYYSKAFSRTERKYCVTRRELLAVVASIKHFHHYLYGRHFLLRSDHGALRWLLNSKNPEGQIGRWFEILAAYDFDIEHRTGRSHANHPAVKYHWSRWDTLILKAGILYRKWENADGHGEKWFAVLPQTLIKLVLTQLHNSVIGGHLGIKKTLSKVGERFSWFKQKQDVENWCRHCDICASKKRPNKKPHSDNRMLELL
jgi:hypothetical protein